MFRFQVIHRKRHKTIFYKEWLVLIIYCFLNISFTQLLCALIDDYDYVMYLIEHPSPSFILSSYALIDYPLPSFIL